LCLIFFFLFFFFKWLKILIYNYSHPYKLPKFSKMLTHQTDFSTFALFSALTFLLFFLEQKQPGRRMGQYAGTSCV